MKTRVLSSIVLIPLVLAAVLVGHWSFALLVVAATLTAGLEFATMLKSQGYRIMVPLLWLVILVWEARAFWGEGLGFAMMEGCVVLVMLGAAWQIFRCEYKDDDEVFDRNPTASWALSLAGGIYLGVGGAYLIKLRGLPDGLWWILMALPIVWVADSAAYFVGRAWGAHKMAPRLSPGKTWEGYSGGVIAGMLSGPLLIWLGAHVASVPTRLSPWRGALLGLVLATLTPLGDLFVSMIKRDVGVKDSGKLIPGHGGAFDRIDSLIWAGILTWTIVNLIV
jgi:phosphatidate cytidylyltransferase